MRTTLRTIAAATAFALLAGCSSSTEPRVDPELLASAATLDRIADSLVTAGVDGAVSSAYHELARVVRSGADVTSVTISVDGSPAEYFATAQGFGSIYCPPGTFCEAFDRAPLNSMVAWQRSDPRRVVQLTAEVEIIYVSAGSTGAPSATPSFANRSTLTFLDGAGGIFVGLGPAQSITVGPAGEPCVAPSAPPEASYLLPPISCSRANFTVSFSGTVLPSPIALRKNTATGAHAISMLSTGLSGSILSVMPCGSCSLDAPPLRPPVSIMANSSVLQPTLRATPSGRDVTLEFTVKNVSSAPVQLEFSSGQQYDFIVRSSNGPVVWVWSADKQFLQSLGSRTLAAGESVTYSERFTVPATGGYNVQALLTSSSHRAAAIGGFGVE
jgi:hypothetical protein